MDSVIHSENLGFDVRERKGILSNITVDIKPGEFVALLGDNGAGKTTFLDLMMGFKRPTSGTLLTSGKVPFGDPFELRQQIIYLSEKVDIPGDWSVDEFLEFNRFFYKNYDKNAERELRVRFKVPNQARLGNMSAGEIRRVQIVGALAANPSIIIIDEITAVLDIVGRRRLLETLREFNRSKKATVVLATNILEGLEGHVSRVLVLHAGSVIAFLTPDEIKGRGESFDDAIAKLLDSK